MPDDVGEIEARIRALSPSERLDLIRALLGELQGPEDEGAEQAWLQEVEKRHKELLDGTVKGVPGDQVFKDLRDRLEHG